MIKSMAPKPIIFAMANPDPEITVEEVAAIRDDAIMATGRSDYPNQVNNVLGFPYIFRGALDVRATHHQHGNEDRGGARAGRARARGRARRGRRRLWRAAEIRPRLHHPGAVRSAADLLCAAGGGQGRHGHRRRAQADRRHGRLPRNASLAARSGRRACCNGGVRAAAPAAAARRLRRGRGGAGHPRRRELRPAGAGHRAAGRPRGPRARERGPARRRARRRHRDHQCRAVAAQRRLCRLSL